MSAAGLSPFEADRIPPGCHRRTRLTRRSLPESSRARSAAIRKIQRLLYRNTSSLPASRRSTIARRALLVGAIATGGVLASIPSLPALANVLLAPAAPVAQSFTAPSEAVAAQVQRDAFGITTYTVVQWPVPADTRMSSGFGYRQCAGCDTSHSGIDLNPGNGYGIQAIADGVVTEVGYDGSGAGRFVVISHDIDGQMVSSMYGHMQYDSAEVVVGQVVTRGQQLGLVGETGQATGPHLHFEIVIDGVQIDPHPWLLAHANA